MRRVVTAAGLGLLATGIVWGGGRLFPQTMRLWEWSAYDARMQWRGPAEVGAQVVLIGRDAESEARFGMGLWDRSKFARVVTALTRAGAAVIAADFHFAGPSPPDRGGDASDAALADATAESGRVVYPLMVTPVEPDRLSLAYQLDEWIRRSVARSAPPFDPDRHRALRPAAAAAGPLELIGQAAQGVGHIAALSDADGVYRRTAVYLQAEGRLIPSLGMAVVAAYLRLTPDRIAVNPGAALVLRDATWPDGRRRSLALPIDEQGNLVIDYAGRWSEGPFPYFSFVEVWDAIEEGRGDELRAQMSGKIVLLLHAGLESDKRRTPLELKAPGGFIHANVINTILTGRGMREVSPVAWAALVGLLAAGSAALLLKTPGLAGIGLVALVVGGYVSASQALLAGQGIVAPTMAPMLAALLAGIGAFVWTGRLAGRRIRSLEGEAQAVRRALAVNQEMLARQETRVEGLEEELAAAMADARASAEDKRQWQQEEDRLKSQMAVAVEEAEHTRREARALEARLRDLTASAAVAQKPLADHELERLRGESARVGILTRDPEMLKVFRHVEKAAPTRSPVLLLGETGTGKELFARAVHELSPRSRGPFVAVNVAALAPDVVESELFGHLKGAFTGADRDRKGYFEQADQGTIFLDEIGDLRPDAQAKLLRVLQEGMFHRVGAASPSRVDVRVVAATNKDLAQGAAQGWFREDLYFRLRGIELRLPPLRERTEDLPMLAERFVRDLSTQLGRDAPTLTRGALDAIARWPWPGNVRELKQRLEQAVILMEGALISAQDLRFEPQAGPAPADRLPRESPEADVSGDQAVLARLRAHAFDMQATAQDLGWDRSTVTQRLKGMCFHALVKHGGDRGQAALTLAGERALARIVEVKLEDYYGHLQAVAEQYRSVNDAVAACRKRYKNLPERYLPAVEALVRQGFVDSHNRQVPA
jgi:DNA-binding NtrC family response regulator/CHASE2 domain-containing sensor protein